MQASDEKLRHARSASNGASPVEPSDSAELALLSPNEEARFWPWQERVSPPPLERAMTSLEMMHGLDRIEHWCSNARDVLTQASVGLDDCDPRIVGRIEAAIRVMNENVDGIRSTLRKQHRKSDIRNLTIERVLASFTLLREFSSPTLTRRDRAELFRQILDDATHFVLPHSAKMAGLLIDGAPRANAALQQLLAGKRGRTACIFELERVLNGDKPKKSSYDDERAAERRFEKWRKHRYAER